MTLTASPRCIKSLVSCANVLIFCGAANYILLFLFIVIKCRLMYAL